MAKLTKESVFFGGNRRKTILDSWQVLQTRAGEKHLKFAFEIPLSNENLRAIPDWVTSSFEAMASDGSALKRATLDRFLEGMTLEVFTTDQMRNPALSLTGCSVKNLYLSRDGEEDDSEVTLHATIYSPANVLARDWAWDTLRGTFWAAFEYSQTEMEFGDSAEEDEADAEDEADEDPRTKPEPKKRGRKGAPATA